MGESNRITHSDIRDMFRLLSECRELGDDAVVWQQHFSAGLARLVGTDIVMVGEVSGCLKGPLSMPGGSAWGFEQGFNIAGYQILGEWLANDPSKSLMYTQFLNELRTSKRLSVTVPRQQLFADQQWYGTADYQMVLRTMGTDAVLHSHCAIDVEADAFNGIVCCREAGRATFDEREVAIVHLLNEEIARAIGGPLAKWCEPRASQLPPRVRQVLRCLLQGDSDKQIAARLNLSPYTVNQYTKQLYRHFGVNGRTPLLARWVKRGWGSDSDWDAVEATPHLKVPA